MTDYKKRKEDMLIMRQTMTLQQIADHYGISRQRVQQIIGAQNKDAYRVYRREKVSK